MQIKIIYFFTILFLTTAFIGVDQNNKRLEKARKHEKEANFDKAISLYSKNIKKDPIDYISYSKRAKCYRKLGRYEEAIIDAEMAIKIDSTYAASYVELAAVYAIKDNLTLSLNYVNKAILYDSTNSYAYNARGAIYYLSGANVEALDDYETALSYDSTSGATYYNKGIIFKMQGKQAKALEMFNKALICEPLHNLNLFQKGFVLFDLGRFQDAAIALADALMNNYQVDPYEQIDNGQIYYYKGLSNYHIQNYPLACEDLRNAYYLGYDNAKYYLDSLSCTSLEVVNTGIDTLINTQEVESENLKVYPNPFVNNVTFELNETDLEVEIFNMEGKLVIKERFSNRTKIKRNSLMKNGTYTYIIKRNDLIITSGKIIAQ